MSLRMRVALSAIAVGVACVAATAGSAGAAKGPIIIGVSAPISGASAAGAKPQIQGALLAVAEYNRKGGYRGRQVKLNVLDDRTDPQTSLAVVQKLVNDVRVPAIIGSFSSASAGPVASLIQQSQVPYLTIGAADAITAPPSTGKNYMFRISFSSSAQVQAMLSYVKRSGAKAAVVYGLDGFGIPSESATQSLAKQRDVSIAGSEGVTSQALDMTAQLSKLRSTGANVLIPWFAPSGLINVIKNLNTLNWHPTLLAPYAATNPGFLAGAGSAADGMLIVNAYIPGSTEKSKEFESRYEKKYGRDPWPIISAQYYDGTRLLLHVLDKVGPDAKKIRDCLEKFNGFTPITAMGKQPFHANGDHEAIEASQLFVSRVQSGNLVRVP